MPFRKHSGVNIIKIGRGNRDIVVPSGDEPVYPHDRLVAVGTTEQLESFVSTINDNTPVSGQEAEETDFVVKAGEIREDSFLNGKTLREADMRKSGCMLISVLHGNDLVTNPGADFRITAGDTVWVAGEADSCNWFLK